MGKLFKMKMKTVRDLIVCGHDHLNVFEKRGMYVYFNLIVAADFVVVLYAVDKRRGRYVRLLPNGDVEFCDVMKANALPIAEVEFAPWLEQVV